MANHPEKLDQDKRARHADDTRCPRRGERIRGQHPRRGNDAGDENEEG